MRNHTEPMPADGIRPLVEISEKVRKYRAPVQRSKSAEARRKARRQMAAKSRKANRS